MFRKSLLCYGNDVKARGQIEYNVPGYAMLRGGTICAKHLPPRNMGKATVRSVAA